MSNMTNFMENTLVDVFLRGQSATINTRTLSWSTAPTLYVGLFTASTDPELGTSGFTEVSTSGTGYARAGFGTGTPSAAVAMALTVMKSTQNDNVASTGTGGQTSNTNAVTFPAPVGSNWGTVTGFFIIDTASGAGNVLFYGTFTGKAVNAGDAAPAFNAAAMTVTFA